MIRPPPRLRRAANARTLRKRELSRVKTAGRVEASKAYWRGRNEVLEEMTKVVTQEAGAIYLQDPPQLPIVRTTTGHVLEANQVAIQLSKYLNVRWWTWRVRV